MALKGVVAMDIPMPASRCWYGNSSPCPKLVVLIRWRGSRSIGRKQSGFDNFSTWQAVLRCRGVVMNHETAVSNAKDIADRILAPAARQNDKEARFSSEAIAALGPAGLLGIMLPTEVGGSALGPRTLAAVIATLAEADASAAMVYLMHMSATATIAAARPGATVAQTLKGISAGKHLTTLAFSEAGSRSHFWAPVSRAKRNAVNVHLTAKKSWVTSAGHAQSYVVSALAPEGKSPTDSTLYLVASGTPGLSVAGPWDGLGMRANASAPMTLEDCEVAPGLQL